MPYYPPPSSGSGNVATDTIWNAKGDLAGGTGSDTAARLAVGSNTQVLTADSGESTGMKWAAATGTPAFVGARAYNSTTQTVTAGVETTLTFDSEEFDSGTIHDTGSNTSRLTVPTTGKYLVGAHVGCGGSTGGAFARLRINGTTLVTGSEDDSAGTDITLYPQAVVSMTAADYIEVRASRVTGTTFGAATGSFSCTFEIVFLGA